MIDRFTSYRRMRRLGVDRRMAAAGAWEEVYTVFFRRVLCPVVGHKRVVKMYDCFCQRCGNALPRP